MAGFLAGACGWTHLDALDFGAEDWEAGARHDAADEGAPPDVRTEAEASSGLDGSSESDAPIDDGAPSAACTAAVVAIRQWTFDSGTEAWMFAPDPQSTGSTSWSNAFGMPDAGALQVDAASSSNDGGTSTEGWVQLDGSYGDLTGRTFSAWIWLDHGASPQVKTFVQTGSQYAWADNGTIELRPGEWTCVSIPLSSPSYNQPQYDPRDVIRIGFEMRGSEPFRAYVDGIRIY